MKILLTGAGGFVGHHTLSHLLKTTDHDFIVTDSFRHRGNSARLRSVFEEVESATKRVKVVTHDLTTPIDSVTGREFGDVSIIISMASESHVDRSIEEPSNFIKNNTDLILTLLNFSRQLDSIELFLQISTDEVYGPAPLGTLHKEWDPYFPSNPYSASKAAQESICYSYWRTFGVPMVITNTMNIVGERQDTEKFVPMVISNLINNKPIPVAFNAAPNDCVETFNLFILAPNAPNGPPALSKLSTQSEDSFLADLILSSKSSIALYNFVNSAEPAAVFFNSALSAFKSAIELAVSISTFILTVLSAIFFF